MPPKVITIDQEAYDALPESAQGLFAAGDEDGQYVHTPADNSGLKQALQKERDGRKADAAEAKVNLAAVETKLENATGSDEQLREQLKTNKATYETSLKSKDGYISELLIDQVAATELESQKGSLKLLAPHIRSRCKVVETDDGRYRVSALDEQGREMLDDEGRPCGVKQLVAALKADEAYAGAFAGEERGGTGGAGGGRGGGGGGSPKVVERTDENYNKYHRELSKGEVVFRDTL